MPAQLPPADPAVDLPRPLVLGGFAFAAGLAAAAAPLVVYAGSLALFGLAHVLSELRYVDGRFGRRIPFGPGRLLLLLLGAAVAMRAFVWGGVLESRVGAALELTFVGGLALAIVPAVGGRKAAVVLSVVVAGALIWGAWTAPLFVLVLLAVLHNLTPIGFLYERLTDSPSRRRLTGWTLLLFVLVPGLIASGVPARLLSALGGFAPEATFATVGALEGSRGAFVPAGWWSDATATHLFAAVTYLQLLHYGAVLYVLPRLLGRRATKHVGPRNGRTGSLEPDYSVPGAPDHPLFPWPRWPVLTALIVGLSVVTALSFFLDFHGTRASYGVAAALHAWIEIPVLLFAFGAWASASGRADPSGSTGPRRAPRSRA